MAMISAAWANAIDPAIKKWFDVGFNGVPKVGPLLYTVQGSSLPTEQVFGTGSIGIDMWDNYEVSGVASKADWNQLYKTTFEHREYPLEVPIQRKLFDDNQLPGIFNMAKKIGSSAAQKREIDAVSTFNNAFTAGDFVGPDGVALCSDSHPQSPHNTGDTQDNSVALAVTDTNVGLMRQQMMAFTDDKNILVGARGDLLLVPPELEDQMIKAVMSVKEPLTANNADNPQAGRYRILPWLELTDSNAFFMIDTTLMRQSLMWFDRVPLSIVPKVEDKTLAATWIAYMRYSFGFSDWRWIIGSNAS